MANEEVPGTVSVDMTDDGRIAAYILQIEQGFAGGFERELTAWGKEDALPWIESHWPRDDWPPLAASTVKRKNSLQSHNVPFGYGSSDIPLVESGRLRAAATDTGAPGNIFEVTPFSIMLGVSSESVPWAEAQHDGTADIPPRPWDDLSGEPMERLKQRITQAVLGAMGG